MHERNRDEAGNADWGAAGRASEGRDTTPQAAAPLGLSSHHILPEVSSDEATGYVFYTALGGTISKLKGKNLSSVPPKPGVRGKAMFSAASRKRLLQVIASLDQDTETPLFVTLTYPGEWPRLPVTWKMDLVAFYKRVVRRFPGRKIAVVWRLEPQKRGAPHFHLLVFGVDFISWRWVAKVWAEITSGNAASCCKVEKVRSWRGAMSYAAKYLGKTEDAGEFRTPDGEVLDEVGRHWGVLGRENLPATWVAYVVVREAFHRIRRAMVAHKASKGRNHRIRNRYGGLWSFMRGEDALRLVGLYAANSQAFIETPKL